MFYDNNFIFETKFTDRFVPAVFVFNFESV